MNSMKIRFAILLLIVGLLSACAAQPTETPTNPPTEEVVPATTAPTNAPAATDTSAPAVEPTTESAPATEAVVPAGATVSFATDILPLFESRCLNCHGGNRTEAELSLRTYADVMTGSEGGLVITPGDAVNSVLHEMVATQEMPKRGPKLTPAQVQLLADWINQGALNN